MNLETVFDGKALNAEIKELKNLLKEKATFQVGIERFLLLHSQLHRSEMSGCNKGTFEDLLWDNLSEQVARTAVNEKGRTVLYGIWHATRIEDITMSMLVNRGEQLYTRGDFKRKINAGIDHTGNSLSADEILKMSSRIDIKALQKYRLSVGRNTQNSIRALCFTDLKRKVHREDIERVRKDGAVDDVPDANWLLDFWGNKTVAGILFMPASRHQIIHLRENFRAKAKGLKSK